MTKLINDLFPDENFRNAINKEIFKRDGINLYEDDLKIIETVEEINVSYCMITSLEGIKYFQRLRRLDCYSNNLTSLDLSKNPELKKLDCDNNNITRLDLNKNPELEVLRCHDNPLKTIILSREMDAETINKYTFKSCKNLLIAIK